MNPRRSGAVATRCILLTRLGVLDYANLRFNGQTANVEAGKEEVFVLGEVTVSETNPVS